MSKDRNLRTWVECCKQLSDNAAKQLGDLGSAELWNRRAEGFAKNLSPTKKKKRTTEMLELLTQVGFRPQGARVLDIGCGPGAVAIPLARAGAQVTALDISYKALDYLTAQAQREGLQIDTRECSWWKANIDKLGFRQNFDLVVASMTPAVNDAKAFDRVVACSKSFCFYSGFLQFDRNQDHRQVLQRIFKSEFAQHSETLSPFLANFMYAYLNGYRPLMKLQHKKLKTALAWEEAAERAIHFYESAHNVTPAAKSKIRAYYRTSAIQGKYHLQSESYMGMMAWQVDQR